MSRRRYGRCSFEASNEDKLLFPDVGITKGELIDYHERIAERMLPHLRERPLVVQRFPDGIRAPGFYQKQVGAHFPSWLRTVKVELRTTGATQELAVADTRAALAYLADQACIALHPWLSRADRLEHPDQLVIDLDPPEGQFEAARTAALRARDLLGELGLASHPKLTGSQGLHVVVAIDRRCDFEALRSFARDALALLAARHPRELTTEARRARREGRLYLDAGRNAYGQTAIAPWSVRALPGAPVAVPLSWAEVERNGIAPWEFTLRNVLRRTAGRPDPWAGWRRRPHSLTRARAALERLRRDAGLP